MNAVLTKIRKLLPGLTIEVLDNDMGGNCEKMLLIISDGTTITRQFDPVRLACNGRSLGNYIYNIRQSLGILNEYALPHDVWIDD